MKILLTGKNGQVGFELQRALAPVGDIVVVEQAEYVFSDAGPFHKQVRQVKPALVVTVSEF